MKKNLINEKINLIQKKLSENKKEVSENYGILLKRRRIEKQRTLEDVASGVCSTSYLSRIENAQVEVKDVFLKHLFEKLEISYEDVKGIENNKIIIDVLKKYLVDDYDAIKKMVNEAISAGIYSDIELKLLLLFVNIIDDMYEDARASIADLDLIVESLIGKELIFFTYLSTLFAFKCNNFEVAYKYIRILKGIECSDEIITIAINDLAMTIYAIIDSEILVRECFNELKDKSITKISLSRFTKHLMEFYYINGKYNINKAIEDFEEIKTNRELNEEELEQYNYYFIKMHIVNKHYEESILLIDKIKASSRIIFLLDYCLNIINDIHKTYKHLEVLKNHNFNKYETFYMFYNEFTIKKVENANQTELVNYMKKNLISDSYILKNSFIHQSINNSYINYLYEIGKYKEAAKFALKIFIDKNNKEYFQIEAND